jgi:hypothetical protein
MVIPTSEVSHLLFANLRRGRPMVRWCWDPEERVPGEIQGALHRLSPDVRHSTASLYDGTHQARPDHRTTSHLMDVVGGHELRVSGDVEVGEPTVLQPPATDHVSGLVQNLGHAMELGESRTRLVTQS